MDENSKYRKKFTVKRENCCNRVLNPSLKMDHNSKVDQNPKMETQK